MSSNGTYKGLIFDFNGVLLWDNKTHEKAWNKMSEKLRGKPFTDEEFDTQVHGRITKETLGYLVGHPLTREESKTLDDEKEQIYMQLCVENLNKYHLSEGAEELLDFLAQNNIPRTIATASPKILLDFYEKYLHLSKWFNLDKIAYNDFTFPGKPAPDIYLRAAEKLGLETKECIVIEDAKAGIKAAHAAKIGFIVALGFKEKHVELNAVEGVNHVISNLGEFRKELFKV